MLIEDYALIGDCETAALVGKNGSIDWLCWPRFDAPACFAGLLGGTRHGRWLLGSVAPPRQVRRRYRKETLILETRLETDDGAASVVDFMPLRDGNSNLVRLVFGLRGRVSMRTEVALRFDYGTTAPRTIRLDDGSFHVNSRNGAAVMRASVPLTTDQIDISGEFSVQAGAMEWFTLSYASGGPLPGAIDPLDCLAETEEFWEDWSSQCEHRTIWSGAVLRSHIILKALTYAPTGGIVAAPTTSLPERIGGVRNWDYRYCWLRDATFALLSLINSGYREEARAWREWLLQAISDRPSEVQPVYRLAGERELPERKIAWLPGYQGSRPVRIGNAAAKQPQLDVYGEVLDAFYQARRAGLQASREGWDLERGLVEHLETIWHLPDHGFWEVRTGPRQFTHSKVMAWVALDRAIRSIEEFGVDGPVSRWRRLRREIHREIYQYGFDPDLNSFVQFHGSKCVDASLLLLPLVGFLPARHPAMLGTVAAIEERLVIDDGLVLRYDGRDSSDGLPPGEGAFLPSSFWLADNYALQGRIDEARELFEYLLSLRNDVGLLAEEYDPVAKRQLGNFPQAFSHLALADTARNLSDYAPQHDQVTHQSKKVEAGRHGELTRVAHKHN